MNARRDTADIFTLLGDGHARTGALLDLRLSYATVSPSKNDAADVGRLEHLYPVEVVFTNNGQPGVAATTAGAGREQSLDSQLEGGVWIAKAWPYLSSDPRYVHVGVRSAVPEHTRPAGR
jgi:hypothetical protein